MAYDGINTYLTKLCAWSLINKLNVIIPEYITDTYENELKKYFDRGYGIVFPFLGNITSVTNEISLTIGNPLMIFNQANRVYSDIALQTSLSGFSNRTVDLGLPFYLGRTIYHGIEGYSSPLGTGPFWAF
jgi:hypothetical protein